MSESGQPIGITRPGGRLRMLDGGDLVRPGRRRLGPVRWSDCLEWADIELHRHLDCPHYGMCLTIAGIKLWPGFSCCRCDIFPGPLWVGAGLK